MPENDGKLVSFHKHMKTSQRQIPSFHKNACVFYPLAYGTAYKTLQPSRMPVVQIEFYIPEVGYFRSFLGLFTLPGPLLPVLQFSMITCLL